MQNNIVYERIYAAQVDCEDPHTHTDGYRGVDVTALLYGFFYFTDMSKTILDTDIIVAPSQGRIQSSTLGGGQNYL